MSRAIQVHHVVEGSADAPVLVLSNSLGTSMAMWDPQVRPLAERFRLVRYDHRGHGRSPVPPGPYRIEDLGLDLVKLLDQLEVERANVCGLSLGGMTAMWVAANAPERVDRMVLCATSAKLGPPDHWAERAATVRDHGTAAVAGAVVARWFTSAFAARNPGLVAEMRSMFEATPAEGYAACCDAIERMDLTADLGSVVAPTLVMVGAQDHATAPEHSRLIADSIPNGRLEVLEDAAHLMNVERAGAVTDLIIGHLHGPPDRAQEGDR